jgi:hypothetical protein
MELAKCGTFVDYVSFPSSGLAIGIPKLEFGNEIEARQGIHPVATFWELLSVTPRGGNYAKKCY